MTATIQTRNSEFEITSPRNFYLRSPLLGEVFASQDTCKLGHQWFDVWCEDEERTVFMVAAGYWNMSYEIPKWLFPKRHAKKTENEAKRHANAGLLSGYQAE